MVSDMAPVDLVLQRAGRLQRHEQNDGLRPAGLCMARLGLSMPDEKDGLPDFGADERVYERAVLLRSWLALRQRRELRMPAETSALIEMVYGEGLTCEGCEPALMERLQRADELARKAQDAEVYQAKSRMIAKADNEDLLLNSNQGLEEDNPEVHRAFRALTRLSDPGITLVCLHQTADGLALEPSGNGAPINLAQAPSAELTADLLRRAVSVQRYDVVHYFLEQATLAAWKRNAALRYHYLAVFDEQGRCPLDGAPLTLVLHRETGLEIEKEAQ
jgi:CRISPR-associated endonuclease/helicase Cas3